MTEIGHAAFRTFLFSAILTRARTVVAANVLINVLSFSHKVFLAGPMRRRSLALVPLLSSRELRSSFFVVVRLLVL